MSFGAGAFKVEAVVVPIRKYYVCKYYDKDTRYQKQKRLVCWLGPALLFFRILIWIFDFGSEKLPGLTRNDPTGPFSWKSRKRFGPVKLFRVRRVCIQDQGSNNCENDIRINLSVNEAKLTGLWARSCAAIQPVLTIEFAFGPEKFPGLSKNEPQELKTKHSLGGAIATIRAPTNQQRHSEEVRWNAYLIEVGRSGSRDLQTAPMILLQLSARVKS